MTKTLYLDCGYGIAGDMTLAALCGLGADVEAVQQELRKVVNFDFTMAIEPVNQHGITANHLVLTFGSEIFSADNAHDHAHHHDHVHGEHAGHQHNHYAAIKRLINDSDLNTHVKDMSLRVFATIAAAESKIHGVPIEEVAFHEVGAMDSIIDIIGNCVAIDLLGVEQIECTPVPTGHGKVQVAHGLYPVPAPATLEMLQGVPLDDFDVEGEITTPTGAALVKTLTDHFVEDLNGTVEAISYGAGTKQFDHPNVLRAVLLDVDEKKDQVYSLTCELDDTTGEVLGDLVQHLLDKGALDVYYTPVVMKKNRPGYQLTLLCHLEDRERFERALLVGTSTFGVRSVAMLRAILDRRFEDLVLDVGVLKVKCGFLDRKLLKVTPEYESVRVLAMANHVSFMAMYQYCLGAIAARYPLL